MASLGAGYYSFNFGEKYKHYGESRSALGSLLALLLRDEMLSQKWEKEIFFLEQKLMPAISALIRKMEKKAK